MEHEKSLGTKGWSLPPEGANSFKATSSSAHYFQFPVLTMWIDTDVTDSMYQLI